MVEVREADEFFQLNQLNKFMIGHKGFIAGGCFKNVFSNQKIRDVDMFFNNSNDFDEAVKYFNDNCNDSEYKTYYENKNVIAYKHLKSETVVELIRKIYGTPEEIVKDFDFTVVKFAYFKVSQTDEITGDEYIEYKVLCHSKFFEHLFQKRIVIDDKITFPHNSFNRIIKYTKYGFYPCRETKIKLLEAIQKTDQSIDIDKSLYEGKD